MLYRVSFTPTLDTGAYTAGDVLFIATEVPIPTDVAHPAWLRSVTVRDKADQSQGIYLYFMRNTCAVGTINGVMAISDANADYITGMVAIASTTWYDLGGVAIHNSNNLNVPIQPLDATRKLYVWGQCQSGTPTYAAASLTFDLWIEVP
jgi:hypothetical protein